VHPIMQKYMSRKDYMGEPPRCYLHPVYADGYIVFTDRLSDQSELEYLAVQPAYRNRGIATMLMEAGIAESERMGIDIFMLAYKAGLGVYRRLGFETLETLMLDDSAYGGKGEYGCYFMERTVKKK
jgi:ribosomal protein S18 acetylase RimI-like enzyme